MIVRVIYFIPAWVRKGSRLRVNMEEENMGWPSMRFAGHGESRGCVVFPNPAAPGEVRGESWGRGWSWWHVLTGL